MDSTGPESTPVSDPVADLVRDLRPARADLLAAVDFDGTLAPLVPDPQQSRPVEGAIEALAALAAGGAQVAVITGRDAATVVRLGGLAAVPGIVVAGIYGIETWRDGALQTPDTPAPVEALRARLPGVLADHDADPAVWIEDKRLSLVVHARRAADPDAALAPLLAPVGELAADLGLETHPGRDVLELRVPGYDKAGALRRLAGRHTAVLYAGDDHGDLPAFGEIGRLRDEGRLARSVAVRGVAEVETAADLVLDDAAAVVDVLRMLAD